MEHRVTRLLIPGLVSVFAVLCLAAIVAFWHANNGTPIASREAPASSTDAEPNHAEPSADTETEADAVTTTETTITQPVNAPIDTTSTPQFIVLAFDGSKSIEMWKETRSFAAEMAAKNSPVKFTYFISGVYLLTPSNATTYLPPKAKPGTSAIGFSDRTKDIADRIEQMNLAMQEGHDIESHANGHFNGTAWTKADWEQEFLQFDSIVANVSANNHLGNEPVNRQKIELPPVGINGFRAPELGRNAAMYDVLHEHHFRYDTSGVAKPEVWPSKDKFGTWEFPLVKIPYAHTSSSILSMDYNFYLKQTNAKDTLTKGTPEWEKFHDELLETYLGYFDSTYHASRAPIFIGHHFSKWNDGLYWEVMKEFAEKTCGLPNVHCVTFNQLADYLDAHAK